MIVLHTPDLSGRSSKQSFCGYSSQPEDFRVFGENEDEVQTQDTREKPKPMVEMEHQH